MGSASGVGSSGCGDGGAVVMSWVELNDVAVRDDAVRDDADLEVPAQSPNRDDVVTEVTIGSVNGEDEEMAGTAAQPCGGEVVAVVLVLGLAPDTQTPTPPICSTSPLIPKKKEKNGGAK